MKLPLSWLKEFVSIKLSTEKLADALTLAGHEVEGVHAQGKGFDRMVIGKVVKIEPHPNADKLRLVTVLIGAHDEIKLVCGGTNIKEGMLVAVALSGAQVRWHGQGDLVELKETEIRGVKSAGMICSASEIGLGDQFPHEEREILDCSFTGIKPGTPLAKVFGSDELVLELDITPNRGDCMSVLGVAREVAAITKQKVKNYKSGVSAKVKDEVSVVVQDKKLCRLYFARVIKSVAISQSPGSVQNRLRAAGIRPINNIVDATNYVMLEIGQPLHAFDADKVNKIVVRRVKKAETIIALDDKTYELAENMLVITDGTAPIAIAGVMGGAHSGVTKSTKNIILESAVFDPISIRKTYRALNLRSESSIRFERGIDAAGTEKALDRVTQLILEWAGGNAGTATKVGQWKNSNGKVSVSAEKINEVLGIELKPREVVEILKRLGFGVTGTSTLVVTVPSWRHDVTLAEDIIEEVGRIHGYNNMNPTLLRGELRPGAIDPLWQIKEQARDAMQNMGWTECMTYSFYDEASVKEAGGEHLELENPLNPGQQFLRRSMLPRLLEVASKNARTELSVKLFEIGRVFHPGKNTLPNEPTMIAAVIIGKQNDIALYREAKGVLGKILQQIDVSMDIKNIISVLVEAKRAQYKIKQNAVVFEFVLPVAHEKSVARKKFHAYSEFPEIERDLSLIIDRAISWNKVQALIEKLSGGILKKIDVFDVYQGKEVAEGKVSLAFHLVFGSSERTLTSEEVSKVITDVVTQLQKHFNATVRE